MKTKLYTLYDTVTEEAGMIFEARNDHLAHRIFDGIEEWPKGTTKKDYKLLKLGCFDKGEDGSMPLLHAHSKAMDITRVRPTEEEHEVA